MGGTLIFSHIPRLRLFWGFKISKLLGFFRNMNILLGMKILWIFLGGHHKNWAIFRGHFYAF